MTTIMSMWIEGWPGCGDYCGCCYYCCCCCCCWYSYCSHWASFSKNRDRPFAVQTRPAFLLSRIGQEEMRSVGGRQRRAKQRRECVWLVSVTIWLCVPKCCCCAFWPTNEHAHASIVIWFFFVLNGSSKGAIFYHHTTHAGTHLFWSHDWIWLETLTRCSIDGSRDRSVQVRVPVAGLLFHVSKFFARCAMTNKQTHKHKQTHTHRFVSKFKAASTHFSITHGVGLVVLVACTHRREHPNDFGKDYCYCDTAIDWSWPGN